MLSLYVGQLPTPYGLVYWPLLPIPSPFSKCRYPTGLAFYQGRVLISCSVAFAFQKLSCDSNEESVINGVFGGFLFLYCLLAFCTGERFSLIRFAVNRNSLVVMLVSWCYAIERSWVIFCFF